MGAFGFSVTLTAHRPFSQYPSQYGSDGPVHIDLNTCCKLCWASAFVHPAALTRPTSGNDLVPRLARHAGPCDGSSGTSSPAATRLPGASPSSTQVHPHVPVMLLTVQLTPLSGCSTGSRSGGCGQPLTCAGSHVMEPPAAVMFVRQLPLPSTCSPSALVPAPHVPLHIGSCCAPVHSVARYATIPSRASCSVHPVPFMGPGNGIGCKFVLVATQSVVPAPRLLSPFTFDCRDDRHASAHTHASTTATTLNARAVRFTNTIVAETVRIANHRMKMRTSMVGLPPNHVFAQLASESASSRALLATLVRADTSSRRASTKTRYLPLSA